MAFQGLIVHLFLLLNNNPLYRCTSVYPFICQRTSGRFQVLAIMHKTGINKYLCVGFFYGHMFSTPLGKYKECILFSDTSEN